MKMFKRSLAVILVVLMAFSSVSLCAFADGSSSVDFSETPADSSKFNYGITTKIFEKDGDNWVLSDGILSRGDEVKARVYIETNYYTATSDLLFAFDKDFYTFTYPGERLPDGTKAPESAVLNTPANQPAIANYDLASYYNATQSNVIMNYFEEKGVVAEGELDDYGCVALDFEYGTFDDVVKFGDIDFDTDGAWENKWAFEITLTVNADADKDMTGETGDFLVLPAFVRSIASPNGRLNLPAADEGHSNLETSNADLWYAETPELLGDPQKVVDSVTFFGNGGTFGGTDTSKEAIGYNGDTVAATDMYGYFGFSKPTRKGYTLLGWKEADETGAVIGTDYVSEIEIGGSVKYFAAVWEEDVTTSSVDFYMNDGTETLFAAYSGTIGDAIVYSGNEPTREGYSFKGWSKQAENGTPETVPATYPSASETYYAVWQLNNYNLQYYVPSDVVNSVYEAYGPAKAYGYGESITLLGAPADSFIPDGYYFLGWKIYDDDAKDYAEAPTTMPAEDVNVYALCLPMDNTVKYYVDGQLLKNLSLETDSAIPTDSASLFQGYEGPTYGSEYFDGWYTDEKCTKKLATDAVVPAGGIELYAKTSIPARFYKEIGDAEPYDVTYAPFNGEITLPDDPTKADGTFTGWTPEPTLMDSASGKDFFGTWGDIDYTVSYYLSGSSVPAFTEAVSYGEEFDAWDAPLKEGYTFNGWTWTEEGSTTAINKPDTMPAKNLVAKGDYTANKYKVVYKVDGATVNTKSDITFGTEIGDYTYQNTGYNDITEWNWSYVNERGDTVKLTTAPVTMPAYDLLAEATSTANVHTLTITYTGAGDATPAVYTKDVAYNTAYSVDSPAVTGYTADIATVSGTMPDSDVRKTVTYTPNNYTVSYKVDGADYQTPDTYAYGTVVTVKAEPTKEGYTFSGWTWKKADGADAAKPTTMPAYNLVAEGTFTVNKHDVVYKNDDGSTYAQFNDVPYGSDMPTVTPPTKEGYTFAGWTPAVSDTVPDKDVDYTATFTANTYNVTYKLNGGNIAGATDDVVKTAEYNAAVPTVTAPTKEGYTFAGWTPAAPAAMPAHDLEFTAQWDEVKPQSGNYTVSIYLMGTDGAYPAMPTVSTTGSDVVGTALDLEAMYDVDDTTFVLDTDKANVLTGTVSADTVNLVAYYKRNTVTITWNANTGKIGDEATKTEKVYIGAAVVAPTATKEGYTFDGWDKDVVSPATADATYTAKWKVNTNDVTYYNEDGSVKEKFPDVNYGDPVPSPTKEPTKEGYDFQGWDTDGDGQPDTIPANMPDEGIDAKPVFAPHSYPASFDANGGEFPDGATTSKDIPYDSAITTDGINEPTRVGYTFKGWSRNGSATAPDADLGKMDSTDGVPVYAVWEKNSYTITYKANGGKFADDKDEDEVTYGFDATIVNHEQPTKEGSSFNGWSWTDESGNPVSEPSKMPDKNLIATAMYKDRHKAIFYKDYATDSTAIFDQTTGNVGDTIPDPEGQPTKDGFSFAGWYEVKPDGTIGDTQVTDFGKYAETDRKFTAKWNSIQANVTFDANSGAWADDTTTQTDTADVGTDVVAPAVNPSRDGYQFLGWSTNKTATEPDSKLGKVPTEGVTFYAVWKASAHTVTFDANGGKFADNSTTYKNGADVGDAISTKLPASNPTREGYNFLGWSANSAATARDADLGTMPNSDKTFYAVWAPKTYTVTYNLNGGNIGGKTENVVFADCAYGSATQKPASDPKKDGAVFEGWTPDVAATVTGDATYTAKWSASKHTITYNLDGGNIDSKTDNVVFTDCAYGSDTPKPTKEPVKEGFVFAGWDPTVSEKVNGDATYKAKWTAVAADEYTITYKNDDGTTITVETHKEGDAITVLTGPTKTGYTFSKWVWKDASGTEITAPTTMPKQNLTATATYTKNEEKDDDDGFNLSDIIDPAAFGKFVDDAFNFVTGIEIDIPDIPGDDSDDGKEDDDNRGGSDIPDTGSVTGIVVFATISGAAAAAYVFTKKKKDDDDDSDNND